MGFSLSYCRAVLFYFPNFNEVLVSGCGWGHFLASVSDVSQSVPSFRILKTPCSALSLSFFRFSAAAANAWIRT